MRVRIQAHVGRQFQGGAAYYSGPELVEHAMESAGAAYEGDASEAKMRRLVEIVGRLVEQLPERERIAIVGLEYELELLR